MTAPDLRAVLLRIATAEQPIRATDLWRRASQETHKMTPFVIAKMWELISEDLLDYDSSAFVTVNPPVLPFAPEDTVNPPVLPFAPDDPGHDCGAT